MKKKSKIFLILPGLIIASIGLVALNAFWPHGRSALTTARLGSKLDRRATVFWTGLLMVSIVSIDSRLT